MYLVSSYWRNSMRMDDMRLVVSPGDVLWLLQQFHQTEYDHLTFDEYLKRGWFRVYIFDQFGKDQKPKLLRGKKLMKLIEDGT